jgi:heavy metal sensor kinase
MVTQLPIRLRLTAWYSAVVGITLILFSLGMYLALESEIHRAIDHELADRMEGVHTFLWRHLPWQSGKELLQEFQEHSGLTPGGDLYQVLDAQRRWVYQPRAMRMFNLPSEAPDSSRPDWYETIRRNGTLIRMLTATVEVDKRKYTIQVATVVTAFYEGLKRLRLLAILLVPVIILCSALGGYWLSRRAMAPIEEITRTARGISEQSLSKRLPLPMARDELHRLSETLNAMLARLEDAFNRVIQFTSDASHELRTPVAIIRTTAELMQEQKRTVAEHEEANAQILIEAERTSNLIEELLTLARADSKATEFSFAEVNLCEVVRQVIASTDALADSKDISLKTNIAGAEAIVSGDYNAIRRLVVIFVDNAIKYSPPGTDILISVKKEGKSTVLEVNDKGIGIAEQDLPHIFKRFYRSDKARSRELGGAGLGLSIAKWIADSHGAQINVASVVGKGSTFGILFGPSGLRGRDTPGSA